MPAYCKSDARQFGNKQGTFPPPSLKRKEGKKDSTTRYGGDRLLVTYGLPSGSGSSEAEGILSLRLVGSRLLVGSEHQERSGNFCDGTVCSHLPGDSFISGVIGTTLAWGYDYEVSERIPEINVRDTHTDTWWLGHHCPSHVWNDFNSTHISAVLDDTDFYSFSLGLANKVWNTLQWGQRRKGIVLSDGNMKERLSEVHIPPFLLRFQSGLLGFESACSECLILLTEWRMRYCSASRPSATALSSNRDLEAKKKYF